MIDDAAGGRASEGEGSGEGPDVRGATLME
jgi:hypothetical protein